MGRPATVTLVEKTTTAGVSYALRITHRGRRHFVHLGTLADGMTRAQALDELEKARARVKLGESPIPFESRSTRQGEAPWFAEFKDVA